jgi:hypothetical protein
MTDPFLGVALVSTGIRGKCHATTRSEHRPVRIEEKIHEDA